MMQLYWATTEDHSEDWFIVASDVEEAARLHENMEGYDEGDATAELVLDIPENITVEKGWPDEELLETLGAIFINRDSTRVVEIAGRKYCEGLLESTLRSLDDDVFELLGQGRVNETVKVKDVEH
jgi:hypothetical protein